MYSSAPFQKLDRKRDNAYVNNCIMSDLVDGIKFGQQYKNNKRKYKAHTKKELRKERRWPE